MCVWVYLSMYVCVGMHFCLLSREGREMGGPVRDWMSRTCKYAQSGDKRCLLGKGGGGGEGIDEGRFLFSKC